MHSATRHHACGTRGHSRGFGWLLGRLLSSSRVGRGAQHVSSDLSIGYTSKYTATRRLSLT
jgi:hypothetical protein